MILGTRILVNIRNDDDDENYDDNDDNDYDVADDEM